MTKIYSSPAKILFLFCSYLLISAHCDFKFNDNGEFTVLQLTDFHYGEDDTRDQNTQDLQRKLLSMVKPDLVVVSGDAVAGYAGYRFELFTNHGFFEKYWHQFTQPFVEARTFYAYTLGNHDAEADLKRKEIIRLDKTNPYSILKTAESIPETATYRIPIYSSQNQSHVATNIWIFDSGSLGCGKEHDSWGCIEESHLDWYDQESKKIKEQYGTNVNHVAFYHIPIPEYLQVYNEEDIYGMANEGIGCPYVNTGFFDRIQKNGDISAMFVGHDHDNDFGGWYQGVEFVYGRKSGYGSYGDKRGARVIKFKETTDDNGEITVARDHYVIEEDGQIIATKEMRKRGGLKQASCLPANENPFIVFRSSGFFDYLKNFVIMPLICVFLWKFRLRSLVRRYLRKLARRSRPISKRTFLFLLISFYLYNVY